MTSVNVQFADETDNAAIVSYFLSAPTQLDGDTRVLGAVLTTDPRWEAYYDAQPTSVQKYLPNPG
ncbi:hypothetical protein [Burkholderia vietnamiensis]|uniref:Uncharacterized protein n=1 Tax=Burkholderia vietnamiensis TaxID=60552 RepID=A0AA45BF51_BURVI|nr:hypothetical protein [Burkholderia vietnamiensis]KVS07755.1 hypothetical protein WK32_09465 [Burkholderia vietnamiensis]PRH42431.1 hypothetical protein C6T65_10330 [Burkholderia vietnamiensis]